MHLNHTRASERNFNDKHCNKKGLRQSIERVNLKEQGASEHK